MRRWCSSVFPFSISPCLSPHRHSQVQLKVASSRLLKACLSTAAKASAPQLSKVFRGTDLLLFQSRPPSPSITMTAERGKHTRRNEKWIWQWQSDPLFIHWRSCREMKRGRCEQKCITPIMTRVKGFINEDTGWMRSAALARHSVFQTY